MSTSQKHISRGRAYPSLSTRHFLPVYVEPDLLVLGARDGHVALRGGDDDRLARRRRPELLAHVHLDGQDIAIKAHFHVFYFRPPDLVAPRTKLPCGRFATPGWA